MDSASTASLDEGDTSSSDPIANLLTTYHSLNANIVDSLPSEPSPLEFMRYVASNRPFVVRKACTDWAAVKKWDAEYLNAKMNGREVGVVITPEGNADAIVKMPDGTPIFVEPYEKLELFSEVLGYIQEDTRLFNQPAVAVRTETIGDDKKSGEESGEPVLKERQRKRNVKYAQTRPYKNPFIFHPSPIRSNTISPPRPHLENNNLPNEYSPLTDDIPSSIPFARIALSQPNPEAINLWLGNDRSVTNLHKDNYENLYVQVRGTKSFLLMPPVEVPCVAEREVQRGRYVAVAKPAERGCSPGDGTAEKEGSGGGEDVELEVQVNADDDEITKIPVPMWDPDMAADHEDASVYSKFSRPLRVRLEEGDMLYLPAMWYHKVTQTSGEEGFACAVNYWYDMNYAGQFWTSNAFARDVLKAKGKQVVYPDLEVG